MITNDVIDDLYLHRYVLEQYCIVGPKHVSQIYLLSLEWYGNVLEKVSIQEFQHDRLNR